MTRCRGLILGRWAKGRGIEALSQETGVCMVLGSAHSCMTKRRVAGTSPYEHPALARAWYGAVCKIAGVSVCFAAPSLSKRPT